ncbi:MAG: methylase [Chloroflexi bacterium HGW-Chloroflexi-6]|nr:MAG: methylase [Chloroflexi bacterium HGW-Chloroflexi-6]
MKITLIYPAIGDYKDEACMEPLPLGALAGMTPPDVEIALYDDRLEPIPYDEPTDLVGISVQIYSAKRAYAISAEYRKRGVPVILGGMHVTLLPEEAAQHADAIFVSDAESLWRQVLEDARHGQLKPVYRGCPGIPQSDTFTRHDLYKGKKYLPISLVQFGRGCPFVCTFCATSAYFDHKHYYRQIDHVLAEIERQGRKTIFFVDDNIIGDFDAAKALFRELIPLKLHWVSQASINMTGDRELMDLMAQSGCLGHVVGFESIDQANLRLMQKNQNMLDGFTAYKPQLEILRDYGLQTWAALTVGHDCDTPESVERTLEFAMKNKFTFAAFNLLMPYPGTPLYQQLKDEKRLLYDGKWWLHDDYRFNHAAFIPKNMSPEQLTELTFWMRRTFNSPASIFYRVTDFKTNLRNPYRFGVYLVYNPLFRKETLKKQGIRLSR